MTATGPAVTPVDSLVARERIERDLKGYAEQWKRLQLVEVEASYGPLYPDQDQMQDLRRSGTCLFDVTLRHGEDCIEASFDGGCGQKWAINAAVVISRRHPSIDKLKSLWIKSMHRGRLKLVPAIPGLEIQNGTWRLDLEPTWFSYTRVCEALDHFTTLLPSSPPGALPVLIGSCFGNSQQRREINETVTPRPPADEAAHRFLNPSQRNAIKR